MFIISGNNIFISLPKVFLFWLAISCMPLLSLSAQTLIGAKAGALFSTLRSTNAGSSYVTVPPHISVSAGFMAAISIKNHMLFQPEVLFAQKGALANMANTYHRYTLSYLEVPLLLRVNIGDKKVTGFVNTGVYGAVLLSSNSPLAGLSLDSVASINNLAGHEQQFDFGLAFGGGLQLKLGPGSLFFEPRINLGILDLDKRDAPEQKSLSVSLFIGYAYQFSKKH